MLGSCAQQRRIGGAAGEGHDRKRSTMEVGGWRVLAPADNRGPQEWAYSGRLNTLVWPAPASVALSLSIATTRNSPSLSPTNSVLPLIMAEGRFGLKIIACSRSGAGFGGEGGDDLDRHHAQLTQFVAHEQRLATDHGRGPLWTEDNRLQSQWRRLGR